MKRRVRGGWIALTAIAALGAYWLWPADEPAQPAAAPDPSSPSRPVQERARHPGASGVDRPEAVCRHRFSHAQAGDIFAYELRLGEQTERLTFQAISISPEQAGAQVRWRVDYDLARGTRRSGEFRTRCGVEEVELRIDSFGGAGAGQTLELPVFPMRRNIVVGDRWCGRQRWSGGTWERCFEVIDDGVVVETAAGVFETLEVARADTMTIEGRVLEDSSHVWLAEGVGVVRLRRAGIDGVTELVAVPRR